MAARLKEQYVNEIAPALNKKFGYKSVMQIPKLDKVIVNVGCGESKNNAKELEAIVKDLGTITGQKAVICKARKSVICKARKSVANFKLREGETVGVKVTLRGDKCGKGVRVGHKIVDGKKIRVCRKCGAEI